ncbi:MAG TPA: CheR family methyltransferase [Candidatus Limnocylindrales bacterium]|nr:CheR family methyltransferase [Candidatus Limnocylindrales bacterium]
MTDEPREDFEQLLGFLREHRGFDFTGYKRSTLMRRVSKRLGQIGVGTYAEYLVYLQAHPEEFTLLFNTILINVTGFFRDPAAWDFLRTEIVPRLLADKKDEGIRVWSAGCASGEEAYSAAIMLAEALGLAQYRERVKVYGTDVDEDALARARHGAYTERDLAEVPPALRERYFEENTGQHLFRTDLRRTLIFGRHDLVQDAPISRIDLLICRNTLMYFETAAQSRILARLHYALQDRGYLFLGKAEMLLSRDSLFVPVALKQRIFSRVPGSRIPERLAVLAQATSAPAAPAEEASELKRLLVLTPDALPLAQLVVDASGFLALANRRARDLFGVSAADLGRPFQDLEVSFRPLELRSRIEQVSKEREPVQAAAVERGTLRLDVDITPILDHENLLGVSVCFTDVTRYHELRRDLDRSKQELETASEELQSTNEELETTNEELQSTVEELETTNEELQSSNEELETMNEELESTNTELQTINTELHQRSSQLDDVNLFMERILGGLRVGVAALDHDLRVALWNHRAEDLWGLRSGEVVGHPLLGLDIGLPVGQLTEPIRQCLRGQDGFTQVTLEAVNRRGRAVRVQVQCSQMPTVDPERPGVIVMMEELTPPRA